MLKRPVRRRRAALPPRTLTREQELAVVICSALHDTGCTCDMNRQPLCSKMVWAAKRALRHLDLPADGQEPRR